MKDENENKSDTRQWVLTSLRDCNWEGYAGDPVHEEKGKGCNNAGSFKTIKEFGGLEVKADIEQIY